MSDKEETNPSGAAEASPEENGVHHESAGAEEEVKGQSPKANDEEDEKHNSKEEGNEANEAIAAAQATAARLMAEHANEAETAGDGEAHKVCYRDIWTIIIGIFGCKIVVIPHLESL